MKISARLMEVLQAIYWNVGSDLEQGVNFVWSDSIFSGTYSYIATGRAIKGDESRLRITPFLLNDLERNELITVRKVFSEIVGKMI